MMTRDDDERVRLMLEAADRPAAHVGDIITDGQAKRIARIFRRTALADTGRIMMPEDYDAVATMARPDDVRDPQGFEADRRALMDYVQRFGPRTAVAAWSRLRPSDEVVPWSYGR